MRKNVKCLLKNFAQGFWLCMVLILIQHDQKIKKPKHIVCTHFKGFSRFCPINSYFCIFICTSKYFRMSKTQQTTIGHCLLLYLITVMLFTSFTLSIRQSGCKCMDWLSTHQPAELPLYLYQDTINHYNQLICKGSMMLKICNFRIFQIWINSSNYQKQFH